MKLKKNPTLTYPKRKKLPHEKKNINKFLTRNGKQSSKKKK